MPFSLLTFAIVPGAILGLFLFVRVVLPLFAQVGSNISRVIARIATPEDTASEFLAACEERSIALARDAQELERVQIEVQDLRARLEVIAPSARSLIPVRVIAWALPGDTGHITVMGDDLTATTRGSAVVARDDVLLGVIAGVRGTLADVRLLTHPQSTVPVALVARSGNRTIGIATGSGGTLLDLRYIPRDSGIAVGDIVVTSGLDGVLPQGLLVGTVASIEDTPSASLLSATVQPFLAPMDVALLSIVQSR